MFSEKHLPGIVFHSWGGKKWEYFATMQAEQIEKKCILFYWVIKISHCQSFTEVWLVCSALHCIEKVVFLFLDFRESFGRETPKFPNASETDIEFFIIKSLIGCSIPFTYSYSEIKPVSKIRISTTILACFNPAEQFSF